MEQEHADVAQSETYDSFPARIVIVSNALAVSIYAAGAYVLSGLGLWAVVAYVAYCLWVEYRVLQKSCVNCFYYGKWCGLGKGKLCSLLFRQGDPQKFAAAKVSWLDVVPDFLVGIIPLVMGIGLFVRGPSWALGLALVLLVGLSFGGTAAVRGSLLCKYCKQRELGCPAQRLFGGAKQ